MKRSYRRRVKLRIFLRVARRPYAWITKANMEMRESKERMGGLR